MVASLVGNLHFIAEKFVIESNIPEKKHQKIVEDMQLNLFLIFVNLYFCFSLLCHCLDYNVTKNHV